MIKVVIILKDRKGPIIPYRVGIAANFALKWSMSITIEAIANIIKYGKGINCRLIVVSMLLVGFVIIVWLFEFEEFDWLW